MRIVLILREDCHNPHRGCPHASPHRPATTCGRRPSPTPRASGKEGRRKQAADVRKPVSAHAQAVHRLPASGDMMHRFVLAGSPVSMLTDINGGGNFMTFTAKGGDQASCKRASAAFRRLPPPGDTYYNIRAYGS